MAKVRKGQICPCVIYSLCDDGTLCLVHKFIPSKVWKLPEISYHMSTLSRPCTRTCCNPQLIRCICSVAAGPSFWTVSDAAPVFVCVFSVVLICSSEGHLLYLVSAIQLLPFSHVPFLLPFHFVRKKCWLPWWWWSKRTLFHWHCMGWQGYI